MRTSTKRQSQTNSLEYRTLYRRMALEEFFVSKLFCCSLPSTFYLIFFFRSSAVFTMHTSYLFIRPPMNSHKNMIFNLIENRMQFHAHNSNSCTFSTRSGAHSFCDSFSTYCSRETRKLISEMDGAAHSANGIPSNFKTNNF